MNKSLRSWQLILICGLVVLIIVSAVAFGFTALTALIFLAGVIITILNTLLSPPPSEAQRTWVVSSAKSVLNVNRYLKAVSLLFWIGAISLSIFSFLRFRAEQRLVSISGYVETADGEPAEWAVVTITLDGWQATQVAEDGTFTFSRVDSSRAADGSALITAKQGPLKTMTRLSLDSSGVLPLRLRLPPGDPPFRILYYDLKGPAGELLLRGELDPSWEATLGTRPFVVENSVSHFLKKTLAQYQSTHYLASYLEPSPSTTPFKMLPEKKMFDGTRPRFFEHGPFTKPLVDSATLASWNVEIVNEDGEAHIWRFANEHDISTLLKEDSNWYRFLDQLRRANRTITNDYAIFEISGVNECTGELVLRVISRDLGVRAVLLQNNSKRSLRLDQFAFRRVEDQGPRLREKDQQNLKAQELRREVWFPIRYMNPGEQILILIEVLLRYDPEFTDQLDASPPGVPSTFLRRAERQGQDSVTLKVADRNIVVDRRLLKRLVDRQTDDPRIEREYVLGPSLVLESVNVNGVSYPVRQFEERNFGVRLGSLDFGSCPFVYTHSPEQKRWIKEGHILYGRDTEKREGTERKRLARCSDRVMISEEEPEISYIDEMFLDVLQSDGEMRTYRPSNALLQAADGKYFLLTPGESAEVSFEIPPHSSIAIECWLGATGFYRPSKLVEVGGRK